MQILSHLLPSFFCFVRGTKKQNLPLRLLTAQTDIWTTECTLCLTSWTMSLSSSFLYPPLSAATWRSRARSLLVATRFNVMRNRTDLEFCGPLFGTTPLLQQWAAISANHFFMSCARVLVEPLWKQRGSTSQVLLGDAETRLRSGGLKIPSWHFESALNSQCEWWNFQTLSLHF